MLLIFGGAGAGAAVPFTIEESLVAALRGSTPLAALISNRVYVQRRPQGTPLPCVLYRFTGREPITTVAGETPHDRATLQIACMADRMSTVQAMKDAVRGVLSDVVGRLGDAGRGAYVNVSNDADEGGQRIRKADGSGDYVYAETLSFTITSREV